MPVLWANGASCNGRGNVLVVGPGTRNEPCVRVVFRSTRAAPADAKVRTAQGAAFHFGQGRVVMLADANVIATQVARFGTEAPAVRIGMGYPGADNRQLLLNIVHWLSGLLD